MYIYVCILLPRSGLPVPVIVSKLLAESGYQVMHRSAAAKS